MCDCYHFTKKTNLRSIATDGLVPSCGTNSSLIGDTERCVYFSEGFSGAIALYVDFDLVYKQLKTGEEEFLDKKLMREIFESSCLEDFLGDGIYLHFKKGDIINDRNFENGCTSDIIIPKRINLVVLNNNKDNSMKCSRKDVVLYMMAHTDPDSISYYGADYPGAPDVDLATARIRQKVRDYYSSHSNDIEIYKSQDFSLGFFPLNGCRNIYL